jgi:hypothetical protein
MHRVTLYRTLAVASACALIMLLTASWADFDFSQDEAARGGVRLVPSASATAAAASPSAQPYTPASPSAAASPSVAATGAASASGAATASASSSGAATASASASGAPPSPAPTELPWAGGALSGDGRCAAFDALGLPGGGGGGGGGYVVAMRSGGLGNQLFQVASAVGLALLSGRTPLLGPAPSDNAHATVAYEATLLRRLCAAPADVAAAAAAVPLLQPGDAFTFAGDLRPPADARAVSMHGYWQDPRYAAPLGAAGVAALFAPPPALAAALAARWGPLDDCAAVHVRRGDYVAKAGYHGYMGMAYYEAALTRAAAAGALRPATRLLVFSDDLDWARAQEGFTRRGAVFVDGEDEVAAFYLMAACARTAVVCPNSTFCWWAAFLARARAAAAGRAAGYVAMPRRWVVALNAPNIYFDGVDIIDEGAISSRRRRQLAARKSRRAEGRANF